MRERLSVGAELLSLVKIDKKSWGRCALLANQASLSEQYVSSYKIIKDFLAEQLILCFAPQHGYWSLEQDNMLESPHESLGTHPLYSLYSDVREPSLEMIKDIDTIIVDLQIVGCRVYTFKSTILNCLKVAKRYGKKVVILDRPNPIGGVDLEGPLLEPELLSFVGPDIIPMRHGLTVGELALFFNKKISAELDVVLMKAWEPKSYWCDYRKYWFYTSPNLPNFDSVVLYPGMVLFEGTNISEGRGTCLPFQLIGAPFIKDSELFIKRAYDYGGKFAGVHLRPVVFKPTFNKWKDEVCRGVQICIIDHMKVKSFWLALSLLRSFMDFGGDKFSWTSPPYEYEYKKSPISLITGSHEFVKNITTSEGLSAWLNKGLKEYSLAAAEILLYKRKML